ncbi:MAG: hypothetical protein IBJ03_14255 [Gemmatimonadaceae bacterium]|nr:hypothetical protein [Gemmatimonadaceae bacterium]
MRLAWPRLPGLILALIWMTARIALPLQPDCPHHAAANAANAANVASTASHVGTHHGSHHADDSRAPADDGSSSPSSVECECAAHCCAAATIDLPHCEQIHDTPVAKLATAAPLATNDQVPNARTDLRQPPSNAPPAALTA